MKTETRSSIFMIIAFVAGIASGIAYQQRTDEHRLIMAEWKKVTGMNQLIDIKLNNEIENVRKERKGGKFK